MNRNDELSRLAQADRTIASAEMALMDQIACVDKEGVNGHENALAERVLRAFAANVDALKQRRNLIVRTVEQIDRGTI